MAINIIRSHERYTASHGWLTSRFSFSFSEYYDPNNRNFGNLRVFNDDIIQPGTGFGTHPHANMEIVTYVIEGALEHKDSMGNIGVLRAGEVQRMTAGTGLTHSEYNHSQEEPGHFLQLWFFPDREGHTPSWEERKFTKEQQQNRLLPVVAGQPTEDALHINQDLTIFLSSLEAGRDVTHTQPAGRKLYLFVIKGNVTLNGTDALAVGDAARITDVHELNVRTEHGAEFMLIDLT